MDTHFIVNRTYSKGVGGKVSKVDVKKAITDELVEHERLLNKGVDDNRGLSGIVWSFFLFREKVEVYDLLLRESIIFSGFDQYITWMVDNEKRTNQFKTLDKPLTTG